MALMYDVSYASMGCDISMKTAPIGVIPQQRSSLPATIVSLHVALKFSAMVSRSDERGVKPFADFRD